MWTELNKKSEEKMSPGCGRGHGQLDVYKVSVIVLAIEEIRYFLLGIIM